MCSMKAGEHSRDDLTARAKIRNAAIAHLAEDGFQKTNLRAIAASADVSVGLISHHFGSKDGLRTACDEYVLDVLTRRARAAGTQDLLGEYLSNPEEYQRHVQYMARAIQEDTPAAGTFVTTMVEQSEAIFRTGEADGTMRPSSDPRAQAVLSILTSLALLTMPPAFARALGHEQFGADVLRRMTPATLELYTHGLYTDDTLLANARKAWEAERPSPKRSPTRRRTDRA